MPDLSTFNRILLNPLCRLEASRSHRILWLLEELQIPYELKTYKRGSDKLADPALRNIHPLGKSPVLTVEAPGSTEPIVLAESAFICEYLCEHYGTWLIPKRYQEGKEGQVGGETESYLRYRYYMHYAEGTIMPLTLFSLLASSIKDGPVPFFIRPITNAISGKLWSMYLTPNFDTNYKFLESQLASSPDGGKYLCGQDLTAADVMMSFPLEAGQTRSGTKKEQFPKLWEYLANLYQREAYKRSVKKIEAVEGRFQMKL